MLQGNYTDPTNNISFATWYSAPSSDPDSVVQAFYSWGLVLPETALKTDATEYIGILVRHWAFSV